MSKKSSTSAPKKGSARRDWKPTFLKALAKHANIRASCHAAGIDRQTAYNHRAKDEEFRAAWDVALEDACDSLEEIARNRASSVSDVLLIFLLKAHRPEKYRENIKIESETKVQMEVVEEIIGADDPAKSPDSQSSG